MPISKTMSDDAVLQEVGEAISQYRLSINRTQDEVANEAAVGKSTLVRLENATKPPTLKNLVRILRAMGLVENLNLLVPERLPSPLAELKKQEKVRQRARESKKSKAAKPSEPWTWGDQE